MMMNNTLAQLRELKLVGMATAVEEQLSSSACTGLSFEERLALMVDREVHQRADKRHAALLKRARLKYPQACIEDVDGRAGRGFERPALMSLALSRWVEDGTAILVTGPTGSGKSWLACALAQYACRRGQSALYLRVPRLAEELRILHGNGGFTRWLAAVARTDVLLLDDWALAAMDGPTRRARPGFMAFVVTLTIWQTKALRVRTRARPWPWSRRASPAVRRRTRSWPTRSRSCASARFSLR